jgi:secreted trypsin-like serine protease
MTAPFTLRCALSAWLVTAFLSACADTSDDVPIDDVVAAEGSAVIDGRPASAAARAVQGAMLAPVSSTQFGVQCGSVYLGTDPSGRPWVATAGHCADALQRNHRFGFGGRDVSSYDASNTVGWLEVVRHPSWNARTLDNDIAVVRLAAVPADARPVQLADADTDASVGETVSISGYGFTGQPTSLCRLFGWCPPTTNTLLETQVTVLSTAECTRSWSGADGTHICVRDPAKVRGACNGDSGGPMFRADGTVVGLTSFGRTDCAPATPQVYTRVSAHRAFIARTTGI